MIRSRAAAFLTLAGMLLIAGCGDGLVEWTAESAEPFVPGIQVRDAAGYFHGAIGDPQSPPPTRSISVDLAYPNPAYINTSLLFTVRNGGDAEVTVVPASGPDVFGAIYSGFSLSGPLNVYGGTGIGRGRPVVRRIEMQVQEGTHALDLDLNDDAGSHLPEGYYRIYLRLGTELQWWDVLIHPTDPWHWH